MQRPAISLNENLEARKFASAEFRCRARQRLDQIVGSKCGSSKLRYGVPSTSDGLSDPVTEDVHCCVSVLFIVYLIMHNIELKADSHHILDQRIVKFLRNARPFRKTVFETQIEATYP
jgi:hypothetical protein